MTDNQEREEIVVTESVAIYEQQDRAQLDVQISTAKAYPRNVMRATNNAIAIVTLDPETAATCNYAVPRGDKKITGPSVHLAKILAQCWGNMRIDAKVVMTDNTHVTSEAVCFDLENNLAIKVQVKRKITDKNNRRFNEDMITVTGNAANSIALRNSILSVVPRGVVDKVYKAAIGVITGDVSDEQKLRAKVKQIFDGFKDTYNVTEVDVLASIGKVSITHVTIEDIVTLKGVAQAIKDGDTSVDEAFRRNKTAAENANENAEEKRLREMIASAKTLPALNKIQETAPPAVFALLEDEWKKRREELAK